uniref:Complement component 8 alpha polypeptide n=1 Tax=Callorhinchus milii TaxID=7868 RepID=V9KLK5_CALMI
MLPGLWGSGSVCLLLTVALVDAGLTVNRTECGCKCRGARKARSTIQRNCELGPWSPWARCSPCEMSKPRFRSLTRPAQFGGQCIEALWQYDPCETSEQCVQQINTCGDQFHCGSGRCLRRRLVCNGDRDCTDQSDEENCDDYQLDKERSLCTDMLPIPGMEVVMVGYNVLTGEIGSNVLDAEYFGGYCEYVYNGEWRDLRYDSECERLYYNDDEKYFRKPHNLLMYRIEAVADSGFAVEAYNDLNSLLEASVTGDSMSLGLSVQVNVKVSMEGSEHSRHLSNLTKYTSKNMAFTRISTKVQTGRFRLRSRDLVLHEEMLSSVLELPEEYDYAIYSRFISQYGTHYLTAGTLGGVFESVLVMDKQKLRESEMTSSKVGVCLGFSIGVSNVHFGGHSCRTTGSSHQESKNSSSYIQDIITTVRGGALQSTPNSFPDYKAFRHWGQSLKYNPIVTDFETMPIYELLTRSNARSSEAQRGNLRRAVEQYLREFSPCRCPICFHNGRTLLWNNICRCDCLPGYLGQTCQETKRTEPAHGSWGCWSDWSPCQRGSRQRARNCDHPPPGPGGLTCLGKPTQSQRC